MFACLAFSSRADRCRLISLLHLSRQSYCMLSGEFHLRSSRNNDVILSTTVEFIG